MQEYLPPASYNKQQTIDDILNWTANNLIKLDEAKFYCHTQFHLGFSENLASFSLQDGATK